MFPTQVTSVSSSYPTPPINRRLRPESQETRNLSSKLQARGGAWAALDVSMHTGLLWRIFDWEIWFSLGSEFMS